MSERPAPARPLVRDSREVDLAAITAIYAHHVRFGLGSFEEVPPALAEIARRRAEILARRLPYLVAEGAGGAILGYAYAAPFRARAAYRLTLEDSIYVAHGEERRGVGRALLAALVERCSAEGYRQMVAVIGDSGNAGSISLHERLGFRHVGLLSDVGFKHGRWVDSVLMQRPLGEGGETMPAARNL
jgi:phosphinothricin acetyltransferase